MKNVLLIGAGRSSSSLISYLLQHAAELDISLTIGDLSPEAARQKAGDHPRARAILFNSQDDAARRGAVASADVVISMLPAHMHLEVAADCAELGKHLFTASYVSAGMQELHQKALSKDLLFLNECGLDPGIDHMSAMQIIDSIHHQGGKITSFRSYCGGLVAPESNDNPWGYKFSWNPRNVVLAGNGTAQYLDGGVIRFIPYSRIFTQIENLQVDGLGRFDAYANRDSLSYKEPYGLGHCQTLLRGTLRYGGYCKAWNMFVKLGWTDDTSVIHHADKLTYTDLLENFLPAWGGSVKDRFRGLMGEDWDEAAYDKLKWLGVFEHEPIRLKQGTPAQLLQDLLERKWVLKPHDKDMIVMQHLFGYELDGKSKQLISSLVVKGEDQVHTAMAKTVGLPLAISVKLFLEGKIRSRGVMIPTVKEIYDPVLAELSSMGIRFSEEE